MFITISKFTFNQEIMQTPISKTREEHDMVRNFPTPLYILYNTIASYRDEFDSSINLTIVGDFEKAKQFWKKEETKESEDVEMQDEEPQKKKAKLDNTEDLLQLFPQSLDVEITSQIDEKNQKKFKITFSYLPNANMIVVKESDKILENLFPDDRGTRTPNIRVLG